MDSTAWLLTWVASLELKRPALIGTVVPDRVWYFWPLLVLREVVRGIYPGLLAALRS